MDGAAGKKLLCCLVAVHKDRTFTCPMPDSHENPYYGKECNDGYDSHLSPSGRELVIFNVKQILPCFCLRLSTDQYGMHALVDYYGQLDEDSASETSSDAVLAE